MEELVNLLTQDVSKSTGIVKGFSKVSLFNAS